jgi:hypothetical protein
VEDDGVAKKKVFGWFHLWTSILTRLVLYSTVTSRHAHVMEIVNSKDVCTCLTKHWKITLLFKDNYNNLYFEVVYFGRDRNFVSFFKKNQSLLVSYTLSYYSIPKMLRLLLKKCWRFRQHQRTKKQLGKLVRTTTFRKWREYVLRRVWKCDRAAII